MSLPSQATRMVASRTENPKTVLAFYATTLGIILGAVIAGVAALAHTGTATGYIPWILGFGAVVTVVLMAGVFFLNVKDPSKLMLGKVSAKEYREIQQIVLGNSETGERVMGAPANADERLVLPSRLPEMSSGSDEPDADAIEETSG